MITNIMRLTILITHRNDCEELVRIRDDVKQRKQPDYEVMELLSKAALPTYNLIA